MTLCFSCHYVRMCLCFKIIGPVGRSLSSVSSLPVSACVKWMLPSMLLRRLFEVVSWMSRCWVKRRPWIHSALYGQRERATGRESGMKTSGRAQASKAARPRRCWSAALLYIETNVYWSSAARQATNQPTQPQVAQATKSQSFKGFLPNTWIQLRNERACVRVRVRVLQASGTSVP